ncbi:hypothetical protein BRPE64_ACDS19100 [Caballeronia insecticola]|uniref:Uncharacterized protein n=1 Tax=Caballeronia insecticola TaxID=758793 RepID=R4WHP2_9BURK|nr:hypothetical protein BRPE64_ACDS19100 [Caballeronia insecticola]
MQKFKKILRGIVMAALFIAPLAASTGASASVIGWWYK